jgi:hypothetical protein
MPDAQSVAMLFRRFKTSSRGGKGFTSLKDSEISVSACGLAYRDRSPRRRAWRFSRSDFFFSAVCYLVRRVRLRDDTRLFRRRAPPTRQDALVRQTSLLPERFMEEEHKEHEVCDDIRRQ